MKNSTWFYHVAMAKNIKKKKLQEGKYIPIKL